MSSHARVLSAVIGLFAFLALAPAASATYVNTASFSGPGSEDGQLSHPKRAAVDLDSGELYVVDQANDRVQVFDSAGNDSAQFGSAELDTPFGIAIDQSDGDVYVSDADGVIRFNEDFSPDGGFAVSGATGPLAFDQGANELLVADGATIRRFAQDGSPQGSFDGSNGASAFQNLLDIAVDSSGDVIAIDANGSLEELINAGNGASLEADCETGVSSEVRRYSSAGAFESEIGPVPGCAHAVAIAPTSDNVLIAGNAQSYWNNQPLELNAFAPDGSALGTGKAQGQWNVATGFAADADKRAFMVSDEALHDGFGPVGVYLFEDLELKAPEVTVENASDVEYTVANVKGTVDANGSGPAFEAGCRFEYVTEAQFEADGFAQAEPNGQTAGCGPVSGDDPQDVSATLTGLQHGTTYHLRLFASNVGGSASAEAASTFTTLEVTKPLVTLEPVSGVTGEEASFTGEVNPGAPDANAELSDNAKEVFATSYRFECTPACPGTPEQQSIDADNQPTPVSFDPTGLQPNTEYTVRLFASNRAGEEVVERSFKTEAVGPTAITHLVANLMDTTARFTGFVDPQNQQTSYWFEWGTDPELDGAASLPSTEDLDAGSGGEQVTVARDVAGLSPETTYYWRLVSENDTGTTEGAIHSFTTRATPPPMGKGVGAYGDRVIERVSDADTNGQAVGSQGGLEVSDDGERVLWFVFGATPDSPTGNNTMRVSERSPTGWVSRSALPTRAQAPHFNLETAPPAWSRDLRRFLIKGQDVTPGTPGDIQLYDYSVSDSALAPLARFYYSNGTFSVMPFPSANLDHAFIALNAGPLVPEDPAPGGGIYDVGNGRLDLVSVQPGSDEGFLCTPRAEYDFPNNSGNNLHENYNMVSTSGERLYFKASNAVGECSSPNLATQIYLREAGPDGELGVGTDATTTLVSGPALSGDLANANFIQAAKDGSWAFYGTTTRLVAEDTNSTQDIYRYTVGEGNECITCVVPEAGVVGGVGFLGAIPQVHVSPDGSHAYFTSEKALAPGALAGQRQREYNLYRWREGSDRLRYIAPVDGLTVNTEIDMADLSTDGSVLAFRAGYFDNFGYDPARDGQRDQLTGDDNSGSQCAANSEKGGCEQIYVYDDEQGSLTCVSCAPNAPSAAGAAAFQAFYAKTSSLSADGSDLVFATGNALVFGDVNEDVDFYEWRDGQIGLLSDGLTRYSVKPEMKNRLEEASVAAIAGAGDNIYFRSGQLLDPGADGNSAIYTARIGGGFERQAPPAPCEGDGCQGAPSAPAAGESAGSAAFGGPGNPTAKPKPRCAKGKARRKGRCVKKKASKRAAAKRAANKDRRTSR